MRVEVYGDEKKEAEKVLRLRLQQRHDGAVSLYAVNEDGSRLDSGSLLRFETNGQVTLHESVDRDLGLNLDGKGRLVFTTE